ncbi:MAG: transglycosylase domain-containing protein [Holosporales bacterium]|nr:transglycosylase domain-containing protein [Holosporales bacterium]
MIPFKKKSSVKFPTIDTPFTSKNLVVKKTDIAVVSQKPSEISSSLTSKIFVLFQAGVHFVVKIVTLTALMCTVFGCFAMFILWKYGRSLPDYLFLQNYNPAIITHIYDRTGNLIHELAKERRIYTHLSDMPIHLVKAFISAEDKNFYSHCGIDFQSLIKATILNTLRCRWKFGPIGGSTITQQVAKIFLIGNEHSFSRKIKEAILAIRLESALSKDKILELYLNQIYLGLGSYGVTIAAQSYFNKQIRDLTLAESAFLASRPKAPSHQKTNYKKALCRRNWVLKQMLQNKAISRMECKISQTMPLPRYDHSSMYRLQNNTYYIETARKELIRFFGEKDTYSIGLEATLTIHPQIQKIADDALKYALEKYDERHGWRGPIKHIDINSMLNWAEILKNMKIPNLNITPAVVLSSSPTIQVGLPNKKIKNLVANVFANDYKSIKNGDVVFVKKVNGKWELTQIPEVTGGIAVLDANTGEILGLSGGYSFHINQFNCATQALRQPGSAFKPFVYLAALENGLTKDSILVERPISMQVSGRVYTPHNYNKSVYGGPMSLSMGLTKSRNVFTVILADKIGMNKITQLAQTLGIADYIPNEICVSLGSSETTVLKLAGAYASIFNGGYSVKPKLFLNISHRFGTQSVVIPQNEHKKVVRDTSVDQMKHMLERCITHGTGKDLAYLSTTLPIKIYGKTGTSNDFKDAWFVCCVELASERSQRCGLLTKGKPLIFVAFMGFPVPKSLGPHETGSRVAIPAAEYFITTLCS